MTTKKQKTIYRIGIALTSIWFGLSGLFEITKNPTVWDKTIALGYPAYFIITLGIVKLLGIVLLIIPMKSTYSWVKEWVFAGLFFDIFFALVSGCVVFGPSEIIAPAIAYAIVFNTYIFYRKIKLAESNTQ
ncbi:DoxX family protein [Mariniflexile gromovii]|uniref:DoxX family protein n=1 Tax=Mariniflexile gromovii TaxID=362523 RepID=A0ABS4BNP3_9FLAO|nr:DoxX family protein [Mariniflexile gromovii]MBP0902220.1 DoxX family protein [Mariniflexile gromovii]